MEGRLRTLLNKIKSDNLNAFILFGIILLIIEITFFNGGVIFSFIISFGCIYIGRKKLPRTFGKILFWFGWISLALTILGMMTVKFLILAVLIYLLIQFFQSKKNPQYIKPEIKESQKSSAQEPILKRQPLFCNNIFGQQKTPEYVYEWNDVNIQSGIGDTIIDLSYTVLPKGESVIFVRNVIGNVQVFVPYEIEVKVHHSVLYGATTIFENHDAKTLNQTLHYQTEQYDYAEHKLKIITTVGVGDLEVKRA
ncbi:cell wall-active antibiotics response protein [Bacillus timonensis]|uniref:Cell wall-active antibiotics response protein n=1 Tax=Bacillus timonensis TaxID=1033734 RepID=A0A4S3PIP3_9BACI|nr:cell wall-active antibiotics response protein [Bacillus timonensis]